MREDCAARKGKWSPRGTGMTVLTNTGMRQVTGKAGENGQYSGEMGGSSPWTRPSAPGCGHPRPQRAPARSGVSLASGSLSTGSPARRTHLLFKAGETGQCAVRPAQGQGNKCCGPLARAQPSVIMGTEKVSAGSGCTR